jgi:uncharacterized damage-inducible protein DinB
MAAAGRVASIGFPRRKPDVTRALPSDTTPFGGVRDQLTACQRPQRMPGVDEHARSERATTLAARLDEAAAALISVVANIEPDRWRRIPAPGVWSIGKDAEHVIEAAGYHQWIVRLTIGQRVPSRRPVLERRQLTTDLSPQQAVALLRRRSDEGIELLLGLTVEQLNLPTRPPRARSQALAETIELVLVGHYDTHRGDIEAKNRLR